jgi:hypothetical protein
MSGAEPADGRLTPNTGGLSQAARKNTEPTADAAGSVWIRIATGAGRADRSQAAAIPLDFALLVAVAARAGVVRATFGASLAWLGADVLTAHQAAVASVILGTQGADASSRVATAGKSRGKEGQDDSSSRKNGSSHFFSNQGRLLWHDIPNDGKAGR